MRNRRQLFAMGNAMAMESYDVHPNNNNILMGKECRHYFLKELLHLLNAMAKLLAKDTQKHTIHNT